MEAATYSSDDYELLSETGSAKPRMGRVLSTSANRPEGCQDWPPDSHSGCQTGSSVDENRGPRLRRAVTVRNPERVSTASSSQSAGVRAMDDIEPRRRHGIFLEDLVSWRTNNQRDVRNAIYKKENDVDVRNGPTVEVSKLLACSPPNQSNGMQITRNEMSTTAEPIQCSTTSAPASNKFVANSTQARSISDADDKTEAKSAVPVIEQKANNTRTPVLTLLAAPKNSIGTTAEDHRSPLIDWDPPPPPPGPPPPATPVFTPRTQADTDPGSVDKPQTDSTNLSPSQSSRASTVFCPPWDTAPLGLYLSDLINMTKPLVGSVSGPGANSRPPRDTALRRRTLSAFEHRLWSERLSALSDSSPVTNNRTEVQKLLNWWLHSNGVPPTEERRSDKETSRHGTDTKETNGSDDAPPPPVPQRRRRTRGPKMSLTTSGLSDDLGNRIIVSDIAPYAVVTCAPNIQRTVGIPEHEQPRGQEQQQQIDRLDTTEPFAVYDEAFMDCEVGSANLCSANCCTAVVRTEPLLSAAKSVSSQIGPGVTDSHPPSSYVYAQVVPHHLRRRPEASSAEEQQQQNQDSAEEELGSVSDRIARFQGKPIMTVRSTGAADRADSIRQSAVTTAERVSPGPSTMSTSSSSSSSFSSSESDRRAGADLIGIHENPCRHHQHASTRSPSDNPSRPRASPGRHIRHFVHRLLKDKNGKVAEQVNLFLECTRDGSDRGPYEIMQSIRQFISGMTNYLLRNPELGLPAAVELEKQELSDFGFLNVGAMLESSLQKHVLRPLYRHVIKLLKQEQIKHNELDPMRTYVQWVWSTPAAYVVSNGPGHQNRLGPTHEAVIEHVTQLFHRMERTYSVGCKMHYLMEIFHTIRASNPTDTEQPTAINHNMTTSHTAFEPLCAWVFARSGLLLAPLVVDPVDQQKQQKPQQQQYKQPQHHQTAWNNQQMTVFCPAALQADYLEGLLHKSSLRNQAHSQACLNDLFGMLYWVWSSRSPADTSAGPNFMTLPYRTSAGSQAELEFSDTLHSELFRGLDQGHGTLPISIQPSPSRKGSIGRISDRDDPDTSDTGPAGSVPVDGHFGSTKRRIIPPRRRKTITGLHGTKLSGSGANGESRSGSPVAQSKFHGSFKSNTLNRYSDSKPQSEMTSQDGLGPITPGHSLCPRWRPWAPQTSALSASSTDALVQHHTQNHVQLLGLQPQPQQHLRVLVMDESSNQLQSQSYPLRPTLTVSELSNLIAFKMKIFDPKEFSLFAYVDGREIALDDSFSLSEFVDTTTDFHGSQMTLQGRSTTGTLNSKLDLSNQLMPSLNKSNNVHSVSSRSDSPTGSSTESQKRFQRRGSRPQPPTIQQQQQQQQHSNVPWWVLCKKLSNTNASRFGSGTELVGPAPSAIDVAGAAGLGSWTRPLLIFRRANGYFAISDRLLRSLDDPPSSF